MPLVHSVVFTHAHTSHQHDDEPVAARAHTYVNAVSLASASDSLEAGVCVCIQSGAMRFVSCNMCACSMRLRVSVQLRVASASLRLLGGRRAAAGTGRSASPERRVRQH